MRKRNALNGFLNFQACTKKPYYLVRRLATCSALVLSTFRTDETYFKFSPSILCAISTDKILNTYEMLTCTNDLSRLTNAHE
jgi:hypothetical protein